MHKWRFRTSKFTHKITGLNFFEVHKQTKIQFLEKIKWNSKIYPLGINKTSLLYHLKETSWQSMYKWRSFRTSKFNFKLSGLKFFTKSTNALRSNLWKKKNYRMGIIETCFIISNKFHDNPCINEEVLGLQSSLLRYQGWNFSKFTNTLRSNFWEKWNEIQKFISWESLKPLCFII